MKSRLFHTIVVCGASLGAVPLSCADAPVDSEARGENETGTSGADSGSSDGGRVDRCRLPEGGCDEHCSPLGDGGCLDPCFVHTAACSPDCLRLDGSCGWPPTK